MTGPRRRLTDHVHSEYWEVSEQRHYEQRMTDELKGIRMETRGMRSEIKALSDRVLLMLGGIALLAFIIPLIAPFVRSLFSGV